MKICSRLLATALMSYCALLGAQDKYEVADHDAVGTKIGRLTVASGSDYLTSGLALNGNEVKTFDGRVSLSAVVNGKSKQYILIYISSGGTACYGEFVALELKVPLTFSEAFGNCNDAFVASTRGDDLIVSIPRALPNPDAFSSDERRTAEHTLEIYTFHQGKIFTKHIVR